MITSNSAIVWNVSFDEEIKRFFVPHPEDPKKKIPVTYHRAQVLFYNNFNESFTIHTSNRNRGVKKFIDSRDKRKSDRLGNDELKAEIQRLIPEREAEIVGFLTV